MYGQAVNDAAIRKPVTCDHVSTPAVSDKTIMRSGI